MMACEPIAARVDPHDLDAEAAVLSAVLLASTPGGAETTALATARTIVRPEHFYSEAHRQIFAACIELDDLAEPVDVVLVASRLRETGRLAQVGGMAYLTEVLNAAPAVVHVAAYAKIVARLARRRELVSRLERAVAELRTGADDSGVVERVRREVEAIAAWERSV
jgi:replicative DNA helicase